METVQHGRHRQGGRHSDPLSMQLSRPKPRGARVAKPESKVPALPERAPTVQKNKDAVEELLYPAVPTEPVDVPTNTGPLTMVAVTSIPVEIDQVDDSVTVKVGKRKTRMKTAAMLTTGGMLVVGGVAGASAGTGTGILPKKPVTESLQIVAQPEPEPITAPTDVVVIQEKATIKTVPAPKPTTSAPAQPVAATAPAAPAPPLAPVNEVTVASGDTVGAIATRHGVDMYQMLAANGLGAHSIIYPGQKLVLKGPAKNVTASVPAAPKPAPPPAPKPAAPAPPAAVAPPVVAGKAAQIVAAARGQIGRMQDCTMLVTNSLATVGIRHHGWPVSYFGLGHVVSAAEAVPGDLLYYSYGSAPGSLAHIAVYDGAGMAIHGGWNGNQTIRFSVNVGSGPTYIRVH